MRRWLKCLTVMQVLNLFCLAFNILNAFHYPVEETKTISGHCSLHIIGCGSKAIKSLEEDVGTAVNLKLLLDAHILKSLLTLQSENIALVKKSTAAEGGTAGAFLSHICGLEIGLQLRPFSWRNSTHRICSQLANAVSQKTKKIITRKAQ
jgi:hypothetical protein